MNAAPYFLITGMHDVPTALSRLTGMNSNEFDCKILNHNLFQHCEPVHWFERSSHSEPPLETLIEMQERTPHSDIELATDMRAHPSNEYHMCYLDQI